MPGKHDTTGGKTAGIQLLFAPLAPLEKLEMRFNHGHGKNHTFGNGEECTWQNSDAMRSSGNVINIAWANVNRVKLLVSSGDRRNCFVTSCNHTNEHSAMSGLILGNLIL